MNEWCGNHNIWYYDLFSLAKKMGGGGDKVDSAPKKKGKELKVLEAKDAQNLCKLLWGCIHNTTSILLLKTSNDK